MNPAKANGMPVVNKMPSSIWLISTEIALATVTALMAAYIAGASIQQLNTSSHIIYTDHSYQERTNIGSSLSRNR